LQSSEEESAEVDQGAAAGGANATSAAARCFIDE